MDMIVAPDESMDTAINWELPANTISDMSPISSGPSPVFWASTPNASPIGRYPRHIGHPAFNPGRKIEWILERSFFKTIVAIFKASIFHHKILEIASYSSSFMISDQTNSTWICALKLQIYFWASPKECPAHDNFKKAVLNCKDGDTIAIRHGTKAQYTDGNKGFSEERRGSLWILLDQRIKALMDEHSGMIDYDLLIKPDSSVPMNKGGSSTAASSIYGESERKFFAGGQGVGLINQIISCKEVIQKNMKEADTAQKIISRLWALSSITVKPRTRE